MRAPWFIALLVLLFACQRPPPAVIEPPEFAAARAAVLASLRDPQSATFGALQRGGRAGAVCGTVNARNGFGGYAGPMPFAWSREAGPVLYDFAGDVGQWGERGRIAERFAELGCSIGPDQAKAIAALRALEGSEK